MLFLTCGRCSRSITGTIRSALCPLVCLSIKPFKFKWTKQTATVALLNTATKHCHLPLNSPSTLLIDRKSSFFLRPSNLLVRHVQTQQQWKNLLLILTCSLYVNQPPVVIVAGGEPWDCRCDWAVREMAEPQLDHVAWGQQDVRCSAIQTPFPACSILGTQWDVFFLSGAPYWFSITAAQRSILQPIPGLRWGWHGSW